MNLRRIRRRALVRMLIDTGLRKRRRHWVHAKVYARSHDGLTGGIGRFESVRLVMVGCPPGVCGGGAVS